MNKNQAELLSLKMEASFKRSSVANPHEVAELAVANMSNFLIEMRLVLVEDRP